MICPTCALAADLGDAAYTNWTFPARQIQVFHWLCEWPGGSCTCQHRVPGAEDLEPGMLHIHELDEARAYIDELVSIQKVREEAHA